MQQGTLRVLEPDDDKHLIVSPVEGMVVRFGRNRPEVHICIGADDLGVSRLHGTLEYRAGCWWVRATGRRPVRLGHAHELWDGDDPVPLADGRTSLQVNGTNPHEVHVLRVEVASGYGGYGGCVQTGGDKGDDETAQLTGRPYELQPDEWLVLTVVAQRKLRREPDAALLTRREAVEELEVLRVKKPYLDGTPSKPWTIKMVEHRTENVRERLAKLGVEKLRKRPGETRHDDYYRRILVDELIDSGTLKRDDLRLLGLDNDNDDDGGGAAGGPGPMIG